MVLYSGFVSLSYLKRLNLIQVLLLLLLSSCTNRNNVEIASDNYSHSLSSPNGISELFIRVENGSLAYSLRYKGKEIIRESKLGIITHNQDLTTDFTVEKASFNSVRKTWTQPWGEQKEIRDEHNEVRLLMTHDSGMKMEMIFRVFDKGLGFRYVWPEQNDFVIMDEVTEFNIQADATAWWIRAYIPNRSEHLYAETPVTEVDTVQTPFTVQTRSGIHIAIHEAALTDYASMSLAHNGNGSLEADLVPWKNGDRVRVTTPHVSPWRTIQYGDNAGELITNYLILNLNEPSKIEDMSWIKPGKYTGIWWDMHLGTRTWSSGDMHGATTEYTKELMDFTAKYGFYGVLVEGWNKGWDGDWVANGDLFSFTESYPDFDLEEVTRYGDSLGVRLIGHHETSTGITNYESQVDSAFALYNSIGVEAVKTGYVGDFVEGGEWHHGQFMVRHYRKIVEKAASAKIMLDVHEPIKATGIRRTWPNMMTREGARGQEYNAWSEDGGNPPSHTTIIPFTRILGGPFDYTPGVFNLLNTDKLENPNDNRVMSTLAKELALYVVIYSPLQMVADLPKNLEARPVALEWVEQVPVDWETTVVPKAEIGDYVVTARKDRNSDEWYMGAITDEQARRVVIPLDFLDDGVTYRAVMYRDAEGADWESNPYAFEKVEEEVTSETILPLEMGAGGGVAVRFVPVLN
ncbi:glycoside hydrolase family 97 protein [Balneola sp. MJW-20]|uniref:glycoside hydrolase family 97 protein n=1 Tax=Gracilimonas aurantiaca TaxID=3234185 RepID=UPI0034672798